jgi:hypothetical protein
MTSVKGEVPQFVLEGDIATYQDLADPGQAELARLLRADEDERERLLARAWFRRYHGSRQEAKRLFALLMNEEDIPFSGEDIAAVTAAPPVETQT